MLSQGIWFHLFPLKEILSKIAFKSLHDSKGENLEFYVGMLVLQSCPTLCDPMDCSPPGSSVHGVLQARMLELGRPRWMEWRGRWERGSGWGTHVNPWLIHLNVWQKPLQYYKVISLQLIKIMKKKKKNTGVASHSLLQGIFPPQGSNQGLLHCRQTLYQGNTKACIVPSEL